MYQNSMQPQTYAQQNASSVGFGGDIYTVANSNGMPQQQQQQRTEA